MAKINEQKLLPQKVSRKVLSYIKKNELWGKRLPSQRQLSKELKVSLVTVNKSIKLLKKAGVLYAITGHGTCVIDREYSEDFDKETVPRIIFVSIGFNSDRSTYRSEMIHPLLQYSMDMGMDSVITNLSEVTDERLFMTYHPSTVRYLVFVSIIKERVEMIRRIINLYNCPSVMLDHFIPDLGITGIVDDGFSGMKKMTEYFIKQGHKRIAFFDILYEEYNPWKRQGFFAALSEKGIQPDNELLIRCPINKKEIDKHVERLMNLENPPTAMICVHDTKAMYVLESLKARSFTPGIDVSVSGYGNSYFSDSLGLTTVGFNPEHIGEKAIDCFNGRLGNKRGELITVDTELIIRDSSF